MREQKRGHSQCPHYYWTIIKKILLLLRTVALREGEAGTMCIYYFPNKVKDHMIKTLIDSINGMVEKKLCIRKRLLILPARWYQFMHKMSALHKNDHFGMHNHRLRKEWYSYDDVYFLRKLPNFQARCARAQAAQLVQTALAVYCEVMLTNPNQCY
jgi:hypothetical protein